MAKIDELIEKFKEFKEELNKGVNASYSAQPNATTGTSGGEGGMYRSEQMAEKAEAGFDPKVVSVKKPIGSKDVFDSGKTDFGVSVAKPNKGVQSARHPMHSKVAKGDPIMDSMAMSEEVIKFDKNGQWSLDKVDPQENVNIAHPQGKAKMMKPIGETTNKADGHFLSEEGKNREANPKLRASDIGPGGKVHMVKDEGTNEKAGSSKPHNKGKFKVMDEVAEKESKKEKVAGLPYNGDDKKVHKGEQQGNEAKGNDENKAPGRGTLGI